MTGHPRQLGEAAVLALAMSTALGAWWSRPVPLGLAAVGVLVALAARRPWAVVVAVGVLASALGAGAWAGARPAEAGPLRAQATLVGDPVRAVGAVRAEVRAGGHHLDVWARGRAGAVLAGRAAGEVVEVVGRVSPRRPGDDWAARRHVVGRVDAATITALSAGSMPARWANQVRRLLHDGAEPLPPADRGLLAGFVLGDDRDQSPVVADDFAGAGLGHLLVVSGENVAFLLAVAAPVLRRLPWSLRWALTGGLLAGFALVTRFEPSVLRAVAMAAVVVTAGALGRPSSSRRALALAITGVLLIDPMLVGVLGFQLSVVACLGIVVLAAPLAHRLPGPGWLRRPLAVTLAAQVAVGPLLVWRFGGEPVAGLLANPLAEPAAALLMAWGMTAGLLAGVVGAPASSWLHLPTEALLIWVRLVARVCARLPLGQLGGVTLAVAAAVATATVVAQHRARWGRAWGGRWWPRPAWCRPRSSGGPALRLTSRSRRWATCGARRSPGDRGRCWCWPRAPASTARSSSSGRLASGISTW